MNNRRSKTLVLSMIKTIFLVFIIFMCSNLFNNDKKEIDTPKKDYKVYIQTQNGYELSNSNLFPKAGYVLNTTKSTCTGGATLTQKENYSISFVGEAQNCTLYFDTASVQTYTISFNAHGGSTPNNISKEEGQEVGTLPNSTRTGYTFLGWYTAETGGIKVEASYQMPRANLELHAHWKINEYEVTYNSTSTGGTTATIKKKFNYGTNIDLTPTATREGYTFVGWNEHTTDKAALTTKAMPAQNITIYAMFKKTITITFNANNNTISKTSDTCEMWNNDANCSITSPTITAPTNTPNIIGFSTSATTYTSSWSANTAKSVSANATYYAQTKSNQSTFTINYTKGKGVNSLSKTTDNCTTTLTYNGATPPTSCQVTLPTITLKAGYENPAWSDGSSTASGTKKTLTQNTTLTASSTPITYTITYNLDGGTLANANPTSYTVESNNITLNNPIKAGHTFTGWTGSNGTTAQTSVTIAKGSTGNKTYTANYGVNSHTVTYDVSNCSTGSNLTDTFNYGEAIDLSKTVTPKTGFSFVGWGETATSTTKLNSLTMGDTNKTIYAICKKDVTITFNANNNTISKTSASCTIWNKNTACSVTSPTITAPTNTPNIIGFSTGASTYSNSWSANTAKDVSSNTTYYAQTKSNTSTYAVSYKAGTGVASVGKNTDTCTTALTYNNASPNTTCQVTLPSVTVKAGYQNPKWGTLEPGASATLSTASNTLTATASIITYTITYELNGGTVNPSNPTSYNVETATITLNNPTKTGSTFTGWTGSNGTTAQTTVKIDKGSTGNKTFTANFDVNNYTVDYYNGSTKLDTDSYTYGTSNQLKSIEDLGASESGYTFYGWAESSNSVVKKYGDQAEYSPTANIQLYAVWKRTAKFYSGNSTTPVNKDQFKNGTTYKVTAPAITALDGWTATGWRTDTNASTKAYGSASAGDITANAGPNFYAVYTRTVTVYSGINKATNKTTTQYHNSGSNGTGTYNLTMPEAPTAITGWTVLGYRTDTDPKTNTEPLSGTSSNNIGPTLYAVYSRDLTMAYNGNGATSGSTASHTSKQYYNSNGTTSSVTFKTSANGFTKTGSTFSKWANDSVSGAQVAAGGNAAAFNPEVTATGAALTKTMYAIWDEIEYKVNYYQGNGTSTAGTHLLGTQDAHYGDSITLKTYNELNGVFPYSTEDNAATGNTNYRWEFYGWTTNQTGTTRNYTNGQSFTYNLTGDLNLYALGSKGFYFNGGIAPLGRISSDTQIWNPYSTSANYLTAISVPETVDIPSWTFLGYKGGSNSANSSVTISASNVGTSMKPAYNTYGTMRSIYSRTVTLVYKPNGGTGTTPNSTTTQYYNSGYGNGGGTANSGATLSTPSFTLANNGFTFSGYSFDKWAEKTVGGTKYAAGATYTGFVPAVDSQTTSQDMVATWIGASYKVEYYNGTTKLGESSHVYGTASNLTTMATLGGSDANFGTFAGWATSTNNTTVTHTDGKSVTNLANTSGAVVKLYAVWSRTANFYSSGSTTPQTATQYKSGTAYKVVSPTPTDKTDWTTRGWRSTTSAEDKQYDSGSTITANVGPNFYGIYSRTVTFKSGKAGASSNSVTQYHNALSNGTGVYSMAAPAPAAIDGWTALGWRDDTTAGAKEFGSASAGNITDIGAATMYAVYSRNLTMAYNGNGSTGGSTASHTSTQYYNSNGSTSSVTFKTASNGFTRTGFTFSKWANDSASGTQVAAGENAAPFNPGVDATGSALTKTMYAIWSANEYTVTYNANGGSGTMAGDTVHYGDSYQTKPNTFTKTGYHFDHWNEKADDTGTKWTVSGVTTPWTWTYTKNITLYAQWAPNKYKATLNSEGATTAGTTAVWYQYNTTKTIDGVTVYYYSDADLENPLTDGYKITPPTKTGYNFGGYYTAANGGGTQYVNASGSFVNNLYKTVAADSTLIAKWTGKTYTVSFNTNSGSGGQSANVTATYGSAMPSISTTAPTRTGYTFMGWYDNADYTQGTQYYTAAGASARTYNKTSAATLYAGWKINQYTLTINPNGGSYNGTTSNSTVTQNYGTTYSIPNNPTKAGYIFNGWTKSGTGTFNYYDSSSTVTETKTFNYNSSSSTLPNAYNNSGGGTVTNEMVADSTATGGYSLKITTNGTASPGAGGISMGSVFPTTPERINVIEVKAKIPTGYNLTSVTGMNYQGIASAYKSDSYAGTGDWKTYYIVYYFGKTGTFSSNLWLYVSGSNNTSVTWYVNSIVMKSYTKDQFKSKFTFGAGNGTLTASWAVSGSRISFNTNGGTFNTTYVKSWSNGYYSANSTSAWRYYTYDADYGTHPGDSNYNWTPDTRVTSRTGYTFDGWQTSASGGTQIFNANGTLIASLSGYSDSSSKWIKYDDNLTLFAKWVGKTYTATFYYNSNATNGSTTIATATASCTVSNTAGTCEATIPSAVTGSVGTYNNAYAGVTKTTGAMVNTKDTKVTLSGNATYYATYSTEVTAYRPSSTSATTTQKYYRNQWFTNTTTMASSVLATSNTGTSAGGNPTMVSGYSFNRFTTAVNNGGTAYTTVAALTNTNVTTVYVTETKSVTATFYYNSNTTNGSVTVSSATASGTQTLYPTSTSAATVSNGGISIPTAVSGSVGQYNNAYVGVATAVNSMSSSTSATTASTTYYAVYRTAVNVYRPTSTSAAANQQYYRNQWFTSTSAMADPVLSTSTTGTSNVTPTMVSGYSFSSIRTAASNGGTAYTVANGAKTNTTTFYVTETKSVTSTFYYNSNTTNGSVTVSTATATSTQTLYPTSTSAATVSNGSCTVPSAVSGSVGQYNNAYAGIASAVGSMSAASCTSAYTTYYAFYRTAVNVYRPTSTTAAANQQFYRNQTFKSTSAMNDPVLSTSTTGTSNVTPTMVSGYSFSSIRTAASNGGTAYTVANGAKTNTTTFYVTETKSVTGTFYYNNNTTCASMTIATATASATQTLYPTSTTAATVSNGNFSIPGTVTGSKGRYNSPYIGVANGTGKMATVTPNTGTTTYYAVYRQSVTIYRPSSTSASTSQAFYRNEWFTTASAMSVALSTSNTGTSNSTPTMVSGYTFNRITTSASNGGTGYSMANAAATCTNTFYTTETKSVTATFYYCSGTTQKNTTASGTQTLYSTSTTAAGISNGSISVPSAVTSSSGANSTTYNATSTTSNGTGSSTINTANTKYYANYKKSYTHTATCSKDSTVSSISATSKSCTATQYGITNGSTCTNSGSTSCSVTLPTITPATNYYNPKWSDGSASGASKTLSGNVSLTASASAAYWQNTSKSINYGSFSDAYNAASSGNTLKQLRNSSTGAVNITGKNLYINLNSLKFTTTGLFRVQGNTTYIYGGTMTSAQTATVVVDGGTVYIGTANTSDSIATTIENTKSCGDGIYVTKGTLKVGGTTSSTRPLVQGTCYGIITGVNSSVGANGGAKTVTLFNANVKTTGTSTSAAGVAIESDSSNNTTFESDGGHIYGNGYGLKMSDAGSTAKLCEGYSSVTMVESKASYAIHQSNGTITTGTGAGTGTGTSWVQIATYATNASVIYMTGGTFNYGKETGSYGKGANGSVRPITLAGGTMNLQGGVIRSLQSSSSFNKTNGTLNITGSRGQASGSGSYSSWNGNGTLSTTYYNYRKS